MGRFCIFYLLGVSLAGCGTSTRQPSPQSCVPPAERVRPGAYAAPTAQAVNLSSLARTRILGPGVGAFAFSVAGGADLDRDGRPDIVVGAPNLRPDGSGGVWGGTGAVYLFSAPEEGELRIEAATTIIWGAEFEDSFGAALAVADVSGDGEADLIASAFRDFTDVCFRADLQIFTQLPSSGATLDAADARVRTSASCGGNSFSVADVDGDGISDVVMSDRDRGVWWARGPLPPSAELALAGDSEGRLVDGELWGLTLGSGTQLADADCDGRLDLVSGVSPFSDEGHGLFLTAGERLGSRVKIVDPIAGRAFIAEDLSGDGRPELVVSSPSTGELFFFFDPAARSHHLVLSDADVVLDTPMNAVSGNRIFSAGDLNGDGFTELLVGGNGAVSGYLIFGPLAPGRRRIDDVAISLLDLASDLRALHSAARLGDMDGDGLDDLALGVSPHPRDVAAAPGEAQADGVVYVLSGRAFELPVAQ